MTEITFESLPQAVTQLYKKVENMERLLEKRNEPQPEPDKWFNIQGLCEYLPDKPAVPTVYGWVHFNSVPYHKGQKRLRFLKSEIDTWLMQGRRKTLAEVSKEADLFVREGQCNGR